MTIRYKIEFLPAALVCAMSLTGLVTGSTWAQGNQNPAPVQGAANSTDIVSVQKFTLTGAGCPAQSSTMVTLVNNGIGTAMLRIQFPRSSGGVNAGGGALGGTPSPGTTSGSKAFFQVTGRQSQSPCTVAVQLASSSSATPVVDFTVARAVEDVRFSRPNNQGQLTVTSQIRLNNVQAKAQTAQISGAATSAQEQTQQVTLDNINVRTSDRQINLMAALQLQTLNADAAARLTLEDVNFELRVQP
jgi:hypothetical protein